jgi:hypothetical protein
MCQKQRMVWDRLQREGVHAPYFSELSDLTPGVYSSRYLNPPSGEDCTTLLVREDGSLGWAGEDGTQIEDARGYTSMFDRRNAG